MLDYKTLYNSDPFDLSIKKKNSWFLINQRKLSLYHYKYSKNYNDLKNANEENYKLNTGDLGFFDKDGFFYITSRISKIAKIFGYRVDIGALENLMSQKGYKVACLSDNKKIFIFIEKKYNKTNLINAISKITNLNIGSFELIKLKYFPRTSNNKINYNELKKLDARL